MSDDPPRRTTAEFRAEGGNALLLKQAYADAYEKAMKDFMARRSMYRWEDAMTPEHVKILANLAGGYAREAVANFSFELMQQIINEKTTKAEYEAPTRQEEVPRTITRGFEKPK
jgi:acetoin utilization deacetylase AcuC-like enzyme